MRPSDDEILSRWLAAERDGRDDDAEAALFVLVEALPPLAPPAGFADRVLARVAVAPLAQASAPLPVRWAWLSSLWFRALVALSLVVTGTALPWLSEILRSLVSQVSVLWSPGDVVRLGTGALIAISQSLVAALALWDWLLGIGRALAAPFATPAMALVSVGCLLVSLVAFHFLRNLITRDRSWIHVEPL